MVVSRIDINEGDDSSGAVVNPRLSVDAILEGIVVGIRIVDSSEAQGEIILIVSELQRLALSSQRTEAVGLIADANTIENNGWHK